MLHNTEVYIVLCLGKILCIIKRCPVRHNCSHFPLMSFKIASRELFYSFFKIQLILTSLRGGRAGSWRHSSHVRCVQPSFVLFIHFFFSHRQFTFCLIQNFVLLFIVLQDVILLISLKPLTALLSGKSVLYCISRPRNTTLFDKIVFYTLLTKNAFSHFTFWAISTVFLRHK